MDGSAATGSAGTFGRTGLAGPLAGGIGVPVVLLVIITAVFSAAIPVIRSAHEPSTVAPGAYPEGALPFVEMYADAAAVYGVNQHVLMAIHEHESNYGRSLLPGVHDKLNFAGCCAGPMQFSVVGAHGGTWGSFRDAHLKAKLPRPADYPNRRAPHPSVYDSYYAIYAAAAYLQELGAGPQLDDRTYQALLRYGGKPPASIPYAKRVYERAKELQRSAGLAIGDTKPRTLERVIAVANWIDDQRLPYCWAGGHGTAPGPSLGDWCDFGHGRDYDADVVGLDCSGAIRWLLVLSGYPDPGGGSSGSYGRYLKPRRGEHVTFYYGRGHIYATIDDRVWEASPAAPELLAGWSRPRLPVGYVAGHVDGL